MYQFVNEGDNAKAGIADFLKQLGPKNAARVVKIVHREDRIFVFLDRKEYREWMEKNPAPEKGKHAKKGNG